MGSVSVSMTMEFFTYKTVLSRLSSHSMSSGGKKKEKKEIGDVQNVLNDNEPLIVVSAQEFSYLM